MNKNMFGWMAAATLTLLAQAGFAQNAGHTLKAKIPFAFQTSNASMSEGVYHVKVIGNNGVPALLFRNLETHKASIVIARWLSDTKSGDAAVSFTCAGKDKCSAQTVRMYGKEWNLSEPKLTPAERERTYTVKVPLESRRGSE